MNNIVRVSLFALLAGALTLFGASGAYAEAEVYGDVSASMANVSVEEGDPAVSDHTEFIGGSEANLWWKGGMENLTAKFRFRVRGARGRDANTGDAVSALRGHVQWKASDTFLITFHGRSLGMLGAKEYAKVYNVRNEEGNNDVDNEIGIRNATAISAHLTFDKAINIGAYIVDSCEPACADSIAAGDEEDDREYREEKTIVLEVFGKAGPIRYGLYTGTADATTTNTLKSVESTMLQAGAQYKVKGFSVGLDIGNSERDEDDVLGNSNKLETEATHIGARFGPIGVSFFTSEVTVGGAGLEEVTELDVTYKFKVTKLGHLSLEYRSEETTDTSAAPNVTDTRNAIVFGVKTKF